MNNYKTLTELFISRKNEEQKGITFILGDTQEKYISYKSYISKTFISLPKIRI